MRPQKNCEFAIVTQTDFEIVAPSVEFGITKRVEATFIYYGMQVSKQKCRLILSKTVKDSQNMKQLPFK